MMTATSTRLRLSCGDRVSEAILFDCEFLSADGAPRRFWCGPNDPDPTVVQIGAVRLGLTASFPVIDVFKAVIRPTDRLGAAVSPDPAFTALTGLSNADLAGGQELAVALQDFAAFCGQARIWSWGKDELNLMAITPYIAGIAATVPAQQFGNACTLLIKAGVPLDVVQNLRSHTLCAHFGLTPPAGHAHDAVHDAMSLAVVMQHLLISARLLAADLGPAST